MFGSLISSIDPVATLSILAGVGVSQTDTLYTLVFGESLLNDGVAIVLFEVLKDRLGEDDSLGDDAYKEMTKHFLQNYKAENAMYACLSVYDFLTN